MKRFFFTAIAIAAVAVSCTKSGLLESPQTYETPISFEPYTGKAPVTKATEADDATLRTGFRVIGFTADGEGAITNATKPYLKKMVTGTLAEDKTTTWAYKGDMFWPNDQLVFVAYGLNVNGTPVVNETAGADYGDVTVGDDIFKMGADYTEFIYKVPAERSAQKDLIISPVKVGERGKTVDMQLYHVLSRIGFSIDIKNEVDAEADRPDVAITDIELTGDFITEATFDLETAVAVGESVTYDCDGTPAATTYDFFATDETFTTSAPGKQEIDVTDNDERFLMIIPTGDTGAGANAQVKVSYSIDGKDQTPAVLSLANFQFHAGKAYEFVFTLSTVEVGFGVEVDDWDDETPETYPVK